MEAIVATTDWLQHHSEDSIVRNAYLTILERKGTLEQIHAAIDAALLWAEHHPSQAIYILATASNIACRKGNRPLATKVVAAVQRFILDGGRPEGSMYFNLARLLFDCGEFTEAEKIVRVSLTNSHDRARFNTLLDQILKAQGRVDS